MEVLAFNKTFGLGGMSLVLVAMLMLSGALMLLVYTPVPELAYNSVLSMEKEYTFGRLIRNIHFLSANALVVFAFCHMLRVVFTLGFLKDRSSNWFIGIGLLSLILLSCFTGYLLPWDQTAYWAITICIHILEYIPFGQVLITLITDSGSVSHRTLQIFFTCHTTLIPILFVSMLTIHFWKIRKAGGVIFSRVRNQDDKRVRQMVPSWPNLFVREAVVGACLIAIVMVMALFVNAPLENMANANLSPNPAKAPWYFGGFQELLLHFHPILAVCIFPALVFGSAFALPFLSKSDSRAGTWFISPIAGK
ncbi:MAG: cytochrome b N-terminal domain-containing protein, partial [Hyphomicrobiales bacterium]|nr:cytochrome b N-terminal domain-containing protein [Hyphomicrobiales bacterium]